MKHAAFPLPAALAACLCVCSGCHTGRIKVAQPRTGELFRSTFNGKRVNNGTIFVYYGILSAKTVVGPLVLFPTGFAVGVLDQFVFSPTWDVLCIPRDLQLASQGCGGVVVDCEGKPIQGAEVKPSVGRVRETDADGRFYIPVSVEAHRDYYIWIRKEGYDPLMSKAARDLRLEMRKAGPKAD